MNFGKNVKFEELKEFYSKRNIGCVKDGMEEYTYQKEQKNIK